MEKNRIRRSKRESWKKKEKIGKIQEMINNGYKNYHAKKNYVISSKKVDEME